VPPYSPVESNLERRLFVIVFDGDGVLAHVFQAKLPED
jgi:hypothetical protein